MIKAQKGFTLIELLVVIAIIAVLAGLVLVRVGSASSDARNSKRKADLNQIRTAIEQYRANGGTISNDAAAGTPLTVAGAQGAGKAFVNNDSKGNLPAAYLQGGVYPPDASGTGNYTFQASASAGTYTLSAQLEQPTSTYTVTN